jgi:hypothetical protein
MSKNKAKTYYIHDVVNEMVLPDLTLEDVIEAILMHFTHEGAEFYIFEYGLLEKRNAGFKLAQQYAVNNKFKIEKDKIDYVG